MAVRQETTGRVTVCDGCGRTDAGPDPTTDLYLDSYLDHSADQGYRVLHYCAGCAIARLNTGQIVNDPRPSSHQ